MNGPRDRSPLNNNDDDDDDLTKERDRVRELDPQDPEIPRLNALIT
jgi:hypothetical protein